jgi:hypothetical protein
MRLLEDRRICELEEEMQQKLEQVVWVEVFLCVCSTCSSVFCLCVCGN